MIHRSTNYTLLSNRLSGLTTSTLGQLVLALTTVLVFSFTSSAQVGCYSLNFDGTDDHVAVADDADLDYASVDFTIAAWIKPDGLTGIQTIVNKRNTGVGAGNLGYLFFLSNDKVRMALDDGPDNDAGGGSPLNLVYESTTAIPNDGAWHHVAAVIDRNTTITIYIDGVNASATNISTGGMTFATLGSISNTLGLEIGIAANSTPALVNPFAGKIDEVALWRSLLLPATIADLASGTAANLVGGAMLEAYWDFEDGTGTTTTEQSGNSPDGTLTNGPMWMTPVDLSVAPTIAVTDDAPASPATVEICGDMAEVTITSSSLEDGDYDVTIQLRRAGPPPNTTLPAETITFTSGIGMTTIDLSAETISDLSFRLLGISRDGCNPSLGAAAAANLNADFTLNDKPTATINSVNNDGFCEGGNTGFSVSTNNASTYDWSAVVVDMGVTADLNFTNDNGPGANLEVTNVVGATGAITIEVTLIVSSTDGCPSDPATITFAVNPNPAPLTITGTLGHDAPCTETTYTYQITPSVGSTYTWSVSPPAGVTITPSLDGSMADITFPATLTSYDVQVEELVTATGCITMSSLNVTTKQTPVVNALPDMGPFCPDNPANVSDAAPPVTLSSTPSGASFAWTVIGDATGATGGMGSAIPMFSTTNPGATALVSTTSVVATSVDGCVSTPEDFTVTVNPQPSIGMIMDPSICQGEQYNLQDLFFDINNADANSVNGVVSVHFGTPTDGTNQLVFPNTTVIPPSTLTYYYRKTSVISGPACYDEIPVQLVVEGPVTINSIDFQNNNNPVCEGTNTRIDIDVTNAGAGTVAYQWQVNNNVDGWVDIPSGSSNGGVYVNPVGNPQWLRIVGAPLSLDSYQYRCIVATDECPEQTSGEVTLSVNPVPVVTASAVADVTCNGGTNGSFTFEVTSGSNFVYDFSTGTSYTGGTPATVVDDLNPNVISGLVAGDYTVRIQDAAATACFIDVTFTVDEPAALSFITVATDVTCNAGSDGSIAVVPAGGSGSYEYSINGVDYVPDSIFVGLTADAYDLYVRDANDAACIAGPQAQVVAEPTALEVAPVVTDLTCFEAGDGMIDPMASGGTPAYIYSWTGPNAYTYSSGTIIYSNDFDTDITDWTDAGVFSPAGFQDQTDVVTPVDPAANPDQYWTYNTAGDRALAVLKTGTGQAIAWELTVTNNTGNTITDLTLNFDVEAPFVLNESTASMDAVELRWRLDAGSGFVNVVPDAPPVSNGLVPASAPAATWLTDAFMDAAGLSIRGETRTISGLSIPDGNTFTLQFSHPASTAGQEDIMIGIDNFSIFAETGVGKINDLAAGDYDLTVTDANSCELTTTVTVAEPDELSFTLDPVPAICADDVSFMLPYSAVGGLTNRYQIQNDPVNTLDSGSLDLTTTGFQVLGASPLTVGLNSAAPQPGIYNMIITPRSNVSGQVCTGDPIAFTVYVPNPNSNPVAQSLTICSGANAVFDVTTTELGVPSSFRWAWNYDGGPTNGVFFEAFDGSGMAQISQTLENMTNAPITATFFFRAYTYGQDEVDDNGEAISDDCTEDPANSIVITILPEPAGAFTEDTTTPVICSGDMSTVRVRTTLVDPAANAGLLWSSTAGGSGQEAFVNIASAFTGRALINEMLTNSGTDDLTVTYTLTPYTFGTNGLDDAGTGDDCVSPDLTVDVIVQPEPVATATAQAATICSGDDAVIEVNTTLTTPDARYRWRVDGGPWTQNNEFSEDIVLQLTNTGTTTETYSFEIQANTFGPNQAIGGGDNCFGASVLVDVMVLPEPVLSPDPFYRVCSGSPLDFQLPQQSDNLLPIVGYDILPPQIPTPPVPLQIDFLNAGGYPALPTQPAANFGYIADDTYTNLNAGSQDVTYRVVPFVDFNGQICAGDTVDYVFRIVREPKMIGSTDQNNATQVTICSGDATGVDLVGYFGNPAVLPTVNDPAISFDIEVVNLFGLGFDDGSSLHGACAGADAIADDVWTNPNNNQAFVVYVITPVLQCGTLNECRGEPVYYQLLVEPEPTVELTATVDGQANTVVDNDVYTTCSGASFSLAGMTTTVPTNFGEQIWARIRISGDIDVLGFPNSPNPVVLYGPLGNLNLGSNLLVNTTGAPKMVMVQVWPYIETTPSLDPIGNPQNWNGECQGERTDFTIKINPEAVVADIDITVCSDEPLGPDAILVPSPNPAQGIQIAEDIVFTDPSQIHDWTVPDGVDEVVIEVWGADGGSALAKGGKGAYLKTNPVSVNLGDGFEAAVGAAGADGAAAGGGGASAIRPLVITPLTGGGTTAGFGGPNAWIAAGGGGGGNSLGGGGQATVGFSDANGIGGPSNGGGAGGSYTGMNGGDGAGAGGFGGQGGFFVLGGDGQTGAGDGGNGSGGGGGGSATAGGGGGGYLGGNGGDGTFGQGGFGGRSSANSSLEIDQAGNNGESDGSNGMIRISWVRTLPPTTYTITSIDNPGGLTDGDGVDRSMAPDNMDVADVTTNESDFLVNEQWINTTNSFQTITYNIQPDTDSDCGGEEFTVTVTVEPEPTMSLTGMGIMSGAPDATYMLELCSGDTLMADIESLIIPSDGLSAARFHLTDVEAGPAIGRDPVAGFTDLTGTVPPILLLGSGNDLPITIKEALTNTSSETDTIIYTFTPRIVDAVSGNCLGEEITLMVKVNPAPIFDSQPTLDVCSGSAISSIGFMLPDTSNNVPAGLDVLNYEVIGVTVDPLLDTLAGLSLGLNADISNDAFGNLTSDNNRLVTYSVIFFTDGFDCPSAPVDFTFRIVREPRVSVPATEVVCTGDNLSSELIGYYGGTIPGSSDVNVSFNIGVDPNGLMYAGSNDYNASFDTLCANDQTVLLNDIWINETGSPVDVTYTITPVRQCGSAFECLGEAQTLVVTVEPTPLATVSVTVDSQTEVLTADDNIQEFTICSNSNTFLAQAMSTTVPSDPTHEIWGRLRITGATELINGTGATIPNLFGPISQLSIGGVPLINTTGNPLTIRVSVRPYIETDPLNPPFNDSGECQGEEIIFDVTVYPQPDFDDLEARLCNKTPFGEDLDALANNPGAGGSVMINGSANFNFTGNIQTWVVPEGVTSIDVTTVGADGGNSASFVGGSGASSTIAQSVTPGDTLYIVVGGAGADGTAGGGGGGTGVAYFNPANVIVVGGGGGGAGPNSNGGGGRNNNNNTNGGAAGLANGGAGGGGLIGDGVATTANAGLGGFGAAGGATPTAGGWGLGGGGAANQFGGGGGGGRRGGAGAAAFGAVPQIIAQGGNSYGGSTTLGTAGGAIGNDGSVFISYIQTVPPVTYEVNSITFNGAELMNTSANPVMVGDVGDGGFLADENWMNNTDGPVTVVYNLSPTAAAPDTPAGCAGGDFDLTLTIEPTALMDLSDDQEDGDVNEDLPNETYSETICSGEELNTMILPGATPNGGLDRLRYQLRNIVVDNNGGDANISGSLGPWLMNLGYNNFNQVVNAVPFQVGNGTDMIVIGETINNTGTAPGTVTYTLRPIILGAAGAGQPTCQGEDVTYTVTVLPEPALVAPQPLVNVCSNSPVGADPEWFGIPDTTFYGQPIVAIDLVDVSFNNGNVTIVDTVPYPAMDQPLTYFENDVYRNLFAGGGIVTYSIQPVTADGCRGPITNYEFRILPEPQVEAFMDTLCNEALTGYELLLVPGSYGNTTPADPDEILFDITIDAHPDLVAGVDVLGGVCLDYQSIMDDSWTNPTDAPLLVTYLVTPHRQCDDLDPTAGCTGEEVEVKFLIEPTITLDVDMTTAGVTTLLNGMTSPPGSELTVNVCGADPISALVSNFPIPSSEMDVRVRIEDFGDLLGNGTAPQSQTVPVSQLESLLSFPNGIVNTGLSPSTINIRLAPWFDANMDNVIDGDECQGDIIRFNLVIEPAVISDPFVVGGDDEVCNDEAFTVRLRRDPSTTLLIDSFQVSVNVGANLNQTSGTVITSTTLDAPAGGSNVVNINASFENLGFTTDSVTYYVTPISENGCLGPLDSVTVYVYGIVTADPMPLDVCIGSTETVSGNPTMTSNAITSFEWTLLGGTARSFRLNNQTIGNPNSVSNVGTTYSTEDLEVNAGLANTQSGTIELTYQVWDSEGCTSGPIPVTITIQDPPETGTTIPFVPTICEDGPVVDLFFFLSNGSYDLGGEWTQSGGPAEGTLVGSTFIPTGISGTSAVVFSFTYTIDNGVCPAESTEVTFVVQPTPQAGVPEGTPANLCVGTTNFDLFTLLVDDTYELGGTWSQTLGPSFLPPMTNGMIDPSSAAPGNYEFTYSFPPVGICDGSMATVLVTIETMANAGMVDPGADNVVCNSELTTNLFDLIIGEQPGGTWAQMGTAGPNPNASTGEVSIFGAAPGSYAYRYDITAVAPCTGSDFIDVILVIEGGPAPNPIVGVDDPCFGASEIYSVAMNAGSAYLWTITAGGTFQTPATGSSVTVLWDNTGTGPYTLTLTETLPTGCSTTNTLIVSPVATSTAGYTFTVDASGLTYDFTDTTTGGPFLWSWDFGDGNVSNQQNPTHTFAAPGTYEVCLQTVSPCGTDTYCEMIDVELPIICDQISLIAGVNLISFDVIPTDAMVQAVFAPLINAGILVNVIGIQNGLTQVFDPNLGGNLITVDPGYGFIVRTTQAAILEVCGIPIDPAFKVDLVAGLNMVAYVPQMPQTPADYFDDLIVTNNLVRAQGLRNGLLEVFEPSSMSNNLLQVENGRGYIVRVNNDVNGTDWLIPGDDQLIYNAAGIPVTNNFTFIIGESNLSDDVYIGQYVTIKGENGIPYGQMEILPNGKLDVTTLFGDDSYMTNLKGIPYGEKLVFEFGGQVVDIDFEYNAIWQLDPIELNFDVDQLTNTNDLGLQVAWNIFPNPTQDDVQIELELPQDMVVSLLIYNVDGRLVERVVDADRLSTGTHRFNWEARTHPDGVYLLRLETAEGQMLATEQIVKQH